MINFRRLKRLSILLGADWVGSNKGARQEMCFSLEASINAGLGLAVVGAATVYRAARFDRRMLGFAVFPLVFAVHQLVEGVVWYSIAHPFDGAQAFRYIYTIIAFMVWPVLTPLAAAIADTNERRRRIWTRLTGVGIALALYLAVKLVGADGIELSVVGHSLAYDPMYERPPLIVDAVYVALAIAPLVTLDNRVLKLFGAAVFVAFVYSIIETRAAWYSVWCMSAAFFSLMIAFAIRREHALEALGEASAGGVSRPHADPRAKAM